MKQNRRAQIEFGESIMVVIVLVFLLVIGIVFYFKFAKGSVSQELSYREDMASVTLAKRALALPELRCGDYVGGDTCIDEMKLEALSQVLNKTNPNYQANSREYYSMLFEYANITIDVLDTNGKRINEFTLYSDVPTGNLSRSQQYLFTTLYNATNQLAPYEIAYLNVTRFTRVIS